MDDAQRKRLIQNLVNADDQALTALANRGLLRRALKDLGEASLTVQESDDALLVKGEGWVVTMPPGGPSDASDDTPATGITRQILTATLFLRDHWTAEMVATDQATSDDSEEQPAESDSTVSHVTKSIDQLCAATFEDLAKWAGRTPLKTAMVRYKDCDLDDVQVEIESVLRVHLPESVGIGERPTVVQLLTDRPAKTLRRQLDQWITTAAKEHAAVSVLLSVLVLRRQRGLPEIQLPESTGVDTATLAEDRQRVVDRAMALLRALATAGMSHPSRRWMQRFQSVAISADAARFPRLAKMIRGIAQEIAYQIDRSALADPPRLIHRCVMAYALADCAGRRIGDAMVPSESMTTTMATGAAKMAKESAAGLFGRFRSVYQPLGTLDLHGVGANAWKTASGHEGVTAWFWENRRRQWLSVTAARPQGVDLTFDLHTAYNGPIGWTGAATLSKICHHALQLDEASVNDEGRISTSPKTQCTLSTKRPSCIRELMQQVEPVTDWNELRWRTRMATSLGLHQPDRRASLQMIQPKVWGQRVYDELHQTMQWHLHDAEGQTLVVEIPWDETHQASVVFFEALDPDKHGMLAVFGNTYFSSGRLCMDPISLVCDSEEPAGQILNPQFDRSRLRKKTDSLLKQLKKKFGRFKAVGTVFGGQQPVDAEDGESSGDIGATSESAIEIGADLSRLPIGIRDVLIQSQRQIHAALQSGVATGRRSMAEQFVALVVESGK
ncbi:MAG: hypothetical protein AAFN70_01850 [Planctomycetota bacterium]